MTNFPTKLFTQAIKNYLWHLPKAVLANIIYSFPSHKLTLIGITGTDGKTTTATLIYHALVKNNIKAGLISTIEAKIGHQNISTGLHTTSPSPFKLQKLLKQMHQAGITHVVCEVTSHALDQYRFWGCHFKTAAITNTSHEHLNYHLTLKNYIQTKAKLFNMSSQAILNKDDQSYPIINNSLNILPITYSIKNPSNFQATNISITKKYLSFTVNQHKFITNSNYYYQIYNITAAYCLLKSLNLNTSKLLHIIKKFPEVKGRREQVRNKLGINTIIDYAHTPAALKSTLSSLKKTTKNKLIVIFGATGGRDQTKRPQMGKVVSQYANVALITSDDTRNEDIHNINKQIIKGIPQNNSKKVSSKNNRKNIQKIRNLSHSSFVYINIPHRQDAFNLALNIAQSGDTVIACGKGHETTILHKNTEYPWSEHQAFKTALNNKKL